MQAIVHQLGELFLQAVPTVLILLVFYLLLRALFFKPLLAVMAEREARTAGSRKAAEKIKQYQEALMQARAKVYAEQEAARKKLLDERAARLKDERGKAAAEITKAKERVATELATARREIEATTAQLSAEIARRVLQIPLQRPPGSPAREPQ